MEEMVKNVWDAWISASKNKEFILLESYSGYLITGYDPDGRQTFLLPDVDDETLGKEVLETLKASRVLGEDEMKSFFDYNWRAKIYKEKVDSLLKLYGYKSKKSLFREMDICDVVLNNSMLTISPYHHEKLESWVGTKNFPKDKISIDFNSTPKKIGESLKTAFSNCTSTF